MAKGNGVTLVKIGGYSLTRSEVRNIIPEGIPPADSLLMAEDYVKKWVENQLIYDAAKRNIGNNDAEINRLVEEYRRSLLRHQYQENLIRTRLSSEISEAEKMAYYQENQAKFLLDKNLVRGLFLKIPAEAPGLDEIRKKYRAHDTKAIENIEKYSVQNAAIYNYFYNRWVDFDEILDKIPIQIPNTTQYLKTQSTVEVTDSVYCYLLNISEYVLSGTISPYEYARPLIQELIINKRKVDFLKDIKEELYRDAVRKGEVVFYTDQD
ncbi:MAG: peptidyl-prolyl cis-trans isomerase [Dysgonamonadaceae bacterium]|nr:peptidyl-prolyl cis-trans isomerase [Dysgonamonadaceae bacterium]